MPLQRTPPDTGGGIDTQQVKRVTRQHSDLTRQNQIVNNTTTDPPAAASTKKTLNYGNYVLTDPSATTAESMELNIVSIVNANDGTSICLTPSMVKSNAVTDSTRKSYGNNQAEASLKRPRHNSSGEDYHNTFFGQHHQLELICSQLNDRITDLSALFQTNEKNMSLLTDSLQAIRKENSHIKNELASIVKVNSNILAQLSSFCKTSAPSDNSVISKPNLTAPAPAQLSYANILNNRTEHVVVIKPVDATQINKKTLDEIRSQISPSDKEIKNVRNATNGGIIIECNSTKGVANLQQDAQHKLGENYKVTIPMKKRPKLRVFGLSENLQASEIGIKLRSQNPDVFNDSSVIEIPVVFGSTNSKRFGFKMITDPATFGKIMEIQKLRIGWDLCSASEAIDFIRCYNCSAYHHVAKECKSNPICPKCSGEHTVAECLSTEEKCPNCFDHNEKLKLNLDVKHSALSQTCPVFQRLLAKQRSRTNYSNSSGQDEI